MASYGMVGASAIWYSLAMFVCGIKNVLYQKLCLWYELAIKLKHGEFLSHSV